MATTAPTLLQRHKLTVADYHRMGQVGILPEDGRVELIEGEIIEMPPIGSIDAGTVDQLVSLFSLAVGQQAIVRIQNPLVLSRHSEPEPDLALLKPRDDFYKTSHPHPRDVLLIVEVADTTLRYNREVKVPLYARYGVAEVWLVDLENRCLLVFRQPAEEGYQEVQVLEQPEMMTPVMLPQCHVDLTGLF